MGNFNDAIHRATDEPDWSRAQQHRAREALLRCPFCQTPNGSGAPIVHLQATGLAFCDVCARVFRPQFPGGAP